MAGSFIPTGIAHVARLEDKTLRDTRDGVDFLLNRLPGYKEDLPPRRNIFGEKIVLEGALGPDFVSPFYTNSVKSNPVAQEIVRLGLDLSMPKRKISGQDLNSRQFSEYVELAGKPATQAVRQMLMKWDQSGNRIPDGLRSEIIRKTFQHHRNVARAMMQARYPELIKAQAQDLLEGLK